MPPPTSTTTARWAPKPISNWSPEGATADLAGGTLVGADGDPGGALVAEACPRPFDQRLGPILAGREQREVDGAPGQERGLPLQRAAAAELHDGGAPAD